ncbi:MAG: phosphate acetyltransferase [Leptospiraceae bacterium]|nr:phosphate acetyltransferase [Leptospiraceae bacterium]MCP5500003.1 phosphate acetyltransferase [Leptospiraceae bacterium]
MSKNLYITTTEARSGKSAIALGLMEMLMRDTDNIVFFRPIINVEESCKKCDNDIQLILDQFKLNVDYEDSYAYTVGEARELITSGKQDELLEGILTKYKALESRFDFVLCEGSDFSKTTSAFEFDINADIANNIAAPILLVTNAFGKTAKEAISATEMAIESFEEKGCKILATTINCIEAHNFSEIQNLINENEDFKKRLIYTLPNEPALALPTMEEVKNWLNAQVLYGENNLYKLSSRFAIAAMRVENFLSRIDNDTLVITPGDRYDILLGCLLSLNSQNMPKIAGIVLSGGMKPEGKIKEMLDGMKNLPISILSVEKSTFETASKMDSIHATISKNTPRKIMMALGLFDKHINSKELKKHISLSRSTRLTPKMFEYNLLQKAKSNKQHIVLPEGTEERILKAAEILLKREIVDITLLGDVNKVKEKIDNLGLHMKQANIINPVQSEYFDEYVKIYCELRKDKGATEDIVRDIIADVNSFGTMMIYMGHADGMVSGAIHTTAQTIRPAFQIVKTKPGSSIVSSVFFMCLEDRVLVYGDCAVNPNPSAEELAEIAISSADTAKAFGIEPRVAMLSYSTGSSGSGSEVEKVREATRIATTKRPDLSVEGPMQYDAAVDLSVAKTKMPDSKVAGRATVFIFPDLNTGNNTYKAVQRSAKAVAIGPVLQGLNKPVNDLSRGCLVPDIVNTVAITAIQAQAEKGIS